MPKSGKQSKQNSSDTIDVPPAQSTIQQPLTELRFVQLIDEKLDKLSRVFLSQIQNLKTEVNALRVICKAQQEQLEAFEREKRQNNLIISGIAETDRNDPNYEESELKKIKQVCTFIEPTAIDSLNIVECFRLGRYTGKARPIKIKFMKTSSRNKILTGSKRLRGNQTFNNVYINPDESDLSRKENARLRKVASNLRKENPTNKVYIKQGKVFLDNIQRDIFDIGNQLFDEDCRD